MTEPNNNGNPNTIVVPVQLPGRWGEQKIEKVEQSNNAGIKYGDARNWSADQLLAIPHHLNGLGWMIILWPDVGFFLYGLSTMPMGHLSPGLLAGLGVFTFAACVVLIAIFSKANDEGRFGAFLRIGFVSVGYLAMHIRLQIL